MLEIQWYGFEFSLLLTFDLGNMILVSRLASSALIMHQVSTLQ